MTINLGHVVAGDGTDHLTGEPLAPAVFYIRLSAAVEKPCYWMQDAQNWTTNLADATPFSTKKAAETEAKHASNYGPGKAEVFPKGVE